MNSYIEQKLTWFLTLLPAPQSQADAKERIFFFWAIIPVILSPYIFHALRLTYGFSDINQVFSHSLGGLVAPTLSALYVLSVAVKNQKLNAIALVASLAGALFFTCFWLTHLVYVLPAHWVCDIILWIVLPLAFQAFYAWILYRTSQAVCLNSPVDKEIAFSVFKSRALLFFSVHAYVLYFMARKLFSLIDELSFSEIDIIFIVYLTIIFLVSYALVRKHTRMAVVALTLYKISVLFIPIFAARVFMYSLGFAAAGRNSSSSILLLFLMIIPILISTYLFWLAGKVQKPLKELYQQNKPVIKD